MSAQSNGRSTNAAAVFSECAGLGFWRFVARCDAVNDEIELEGGGAGGVLHLHSPQDGEDLVREAFPECLETSIPWAPPWLPPGLSARAPCMARLSHLLGLLSPTLERLVGDRRLVGLSGVSPQVWILPILRAHRLHGTCFRVSAMNIRCTTNTIVILGLSGGSPQD
jgi:hypothetical protein